MKLKTIANLDSLIEAEQWKARLAASGIKAFIPDEMSAGVAPLFFMSKTGVRLQVEEEVEDEARAIIEDSGGSTEELT
jgi:hypothetical protein